MTLYEEAIACVPEETWDSVIREWKREYPDPGTYVRISGGSNCVEEFARRLSDNGVPFVWMNTFLSFISHTWEDSIDSNSFSPVSPDKLAQIYFASLPRDFVIENYTGCDKIEYYKGMVYYKSVPIPVLKKLHDMGKFFVK